MKLPLTIVLFVLSFSCYSQLINDSTIHKLNQKIEETGISQVIKFRNVVVDNQNEIIRMQFEFQSNNAAKNDTLWRMLKTEFQKNKGIDVRQYLYFYCINTFRISEPKNVLLEIRQSYINQDCPFIQFYYNEDTQKFTGDEKEKICMAEYSDAVSVNALEFCDKKVITENSVDAINKYYEILNKHFRTFYKNGGFENNCKKQKFKSFYRSGDAVLKFDIENLEKEVLRDAGGNFVYSILEFFYDEKLVPYEHIKVEISLVLNKSSNQMEIKTKIIGRYGSGYYRNSKWETMNDMDLGFPAYINDYIKNITAEIIRRITKYKQYGN